MERFLDWFIRNINWYIMKINFCINKSDKYKVAITGHDEYDEISNFNDGRYSYEDTATLNLLIKLDSQENEVLSDATFCEHLGTDYTFMKFTDDGLYKVSHIIVPTVTYLNTLEGIPYTVFGYQDGKLWKKLPNNNDWIEIKINDIAFANIPGFIKEEVYTFTLTNLKDCFAKLCEELLCDLCDGCYNNKNTQNILNRDLVWMAINTINYALEEGNFFLAQKILERINTCSGPCSSKTNKCKQKQGGCNCGK